MIPIRQKDELTSENKTASYNMQYSMEYIFGLQSLYKKLIYPRSNFYGNIGQHDNNGTGQYSSSKLPNVNI